MNRRHSEMLADIGDEGWQGLQQTRCKDGELSSMLGVRGEEVTIDEKRVNYAFMENTHLGGLQDANFSG